MVIKSPPSSALAVEEMTNLMVCATVITGPLKRGKGPLLERKMWASDRLRTLDLLFNTASE